MSTSRLAPRAPAVALVLGCVLLSGCLLLSLYVGQRSVPLDQVLRAFTAPDLMDPDHVTIRSVRVPRTLLAVLVGAALAVAGTLLQTLTRNPLAEPGILGVTAGATFTVVLGTWWWGQDSQLRQLVLAAIGAGVATLLVYAVGRTDPLRLVLAGVALTAVLSSMALGIRLMNTTAFDSHRFWAVGALSGRERLPLLLPTLVIVVGLVAALLLARPLGAIALGDDVAHGLGVPVRATRTATLLVATLLAGTATAVVGPIAFAGLIVPHAARRFAQGSVLWLVGLSLVLGPVLMLASDVVARVLLPTGDVPVAIVVALVGGPVLIALVRRSGSLGEGGGR